MDKIKLDKKQVHILNDSLKQLRDSLIYQKAIDAFFTQHEHSYDKHDKVEVSIDWLKQFIIDFLFWNNQEGKDRQFLQSMPIGPVLLEHNLHAILFLKKAGYDCVISKDGKIDIVKEKKKDAKKETPNKSGIITP